MNLNEYIKNMLLVLISHKSWAYYNLKKYHNVEK